jgi:hypothetical protein
VTADRGAATIQAARLDRRSTDRCSRAVRIHSVRAAADHTLLPMLSITARVTRRAETYPSQVIGTLESGVYEQ